MPTDAPTPDPSERPEVEPLSAVYFEFTEFPGGPDGTFIDTVPVSSDDRMRLSETEWHEHRWEPNPHGGGWEICQGCGCWRIGPFVPATTIDTLTAERYALSAEVARLRGIEEAASERHFIEYPSASDETWQTNARCACGASLLCTELVALAALHPVSEEGPQPGRCAAQMPGLLPDCPPLGCTLRAGHAGMHHDQDGADWSPAVSEEGER